MAGLREKKKVLTREAILTAAAHSFAAKGYEAATMEEIASLAATAVGTLYNYFPSKRDLLFGLCAAELERFLAHGHAAVHKRIDDPADAMVNLLGIYADALGTMDRRIWREGLALAIAGGLDRPDSWDAIHQQMAAQITALLARSQREGHLADVVSMETAAAVVMSVFGTLTLRFVLHETWDVSALKDALRREIYLTFRGLR